MQIKKTIFIAGLLGLATSLTAQNGTSSPYSRFGLGLMQNQSFGRADAMGGSGIAFRITSYNVCYTKLLRTTPSGFTIND